MKHAAKIVAIVLILLTLCSCNFKLDQLFSNSERPSSDPKLGIEDMASEVKHLFSLIPNGTFFTVKRYTTRLNGDETKNDVMLISPDLDTQINLTERIHTIDKFNQCTLSSDCTRLLVQNENNFTIYNRNGEVIYSDEAKFDLVNLKYYYHSDDLNYVVTNYDADNSCTLINITTKQETKGVFNGTVSHMDSDYVYFDSEYDANTAHIYNIKLEKLTEINDCTSVLSIKDNIAFIRNVKATEDITKFEISYYNLDLTTGSRTKLDSSKKGYSNFPTFSLDGCYSAVIFSENDDDGFDYENSNLDGFSPGVHITNLKTKKECFLKIGEDDSDGSTKHINYDELHWVENGANQPDDSSKNDEL